MDLECSIYVDSDLTAEALVAAVHAHTGGDVEYRTVTTSTFELDVDRNSEFSAQDRDDFLSWPYILDVEPRDDVDQETYIASVGQLIVALAAQGLRLVTAADFEHLLPFGGKPGTHGAAVQVEATIVEVFVGAMLSELDPSGSPPNAVDEDAALRTALAVVGECDRDSVRLALDYVLTHPEIDTHDWLNPLGETPDWELRRLLRRAREILWPDAGSAPSQPPDGVIVVGIPDADV